MESYYTEKMTHILEIIFFCKQKIDYRKMMYYSCELITLQNFFKSNALYIFFMIKHFFDNF